jgi:hypothetical protein
VASTAAANAALVEVDSEFYVELVVPAARLSADAVVTATPIPCPVKDELISEIDNGDLDFLPTVKNRLEINITKEK